jgi:5-methylcytosine-specific restriction endonuclease McrA
MAGPLHWNWQGGLSSKNQRNRNSLEYKTWRDSIFHRDNYRCVMCESQGNKLVAHHVLNWSNNEMFRFNVDNGITLCESCHYFTHKCLELDTKIKHMLLKEST